MELAMQKEHEDAQLQLEQAKAEATLQAERERMQNEMQMAREKAQSEAEVAIFRANLDAETKIKVAQINAQCAVDQKMMEAEVDGNAGLGETLGKETPIQKISSMHQTQMDMSDKHVQMLEHIAQMFGEHMNMNRQAMELFAKPKKMTVIRDASGRPTGGILN